MNALTAHADIPCPCGPPAPSAAELPYIYGLVGVLVVVAGLVIIALRVVTGRWPWMATPGQGANTAAGAENTTHKAVR